MNQQQQPHSCVKRNGRDYEEVPRPLTTGTRLKEVAFTFNSLTNAPNIWFTPLYNLLDIAQGTTSQTRTGNSIMIHRIEFEYQYLATQDMVNFPEQVAPDINQKYLHDPRLRILVVQPKLMYRVAPTSNPLTYPYYNSAGDANHPEPLQLPVSTNIDYGLLGLPDPKKYDLEYDDVKNLYSDSQVPYTSGSMTFLVRKRFDFDQERYQNEGKIYFTDSEVFNSIPQIWFYSPQNPGSIAGPNQYQFRFTGYMRIIFDNIV